MSAMDKLSKVMSPYVKAAAPYAAAAMRGKTSKQLKQAAHTKKRNAVDKYIADRKAVPNTRKKPKPKSKYTVREMIANVAIPGGKDLNDALKGQYKPREK